MSSAKYMGMKLEIWDSKKHLVHNVDSPFQDWFWWVEGNGSCDCNRELLCGEDSGGDTCLGSKRYIILSNSRGYSFDEMNEQYPEELLKIARGGV